MATTSTAKARRRQLDTGANASVVKLPASSGHPMVSEKLVVAVASVGCSFKT
jgi:hypothetical protein